MVFSSLVFLFRFLPLTLLAYYAVPKKLRNLVLFLASLVFYAWGEPVYVVLILFSTLVDYTTGQLAGHYRALGRRKIAGMAVAASAAINLSLLGFFKYADFFAETVNAVLPLNLPKTGVALPIGISFYTFQTMSYTIDVYRGDAKVQKNLIAFGAYVSLFPQLIAGPIVRYKDVAKQLVSRRETVEKFYHGLILFTVGLGKKVLIGNQIGMVWDTAASMGAGRLTTAAAWMGTLAVTLHDYFDFSGYSDMAIGLGAMFGFSFPKNFDHPFESVSNTEFWRRWHISLGIWFREYVYIPLGGNRKGVVRQIFNIGVVWFLTGLWHGAHWSFVLWGVYYGILLILEKFFLLRLLEKLPRLCGHVYVIITAAAGFALFFCQDMLHAVGYMKALLFHADAGIALRQDWYMLRSNAGIFLIAVIGCTSFMKRLVLEKCLPGGTEEGEKARDIAGVLYIVVVLTLCIAMLVNSSYNPFLYFRF